MKVEQPELKAIQYRLQTLQSSQPPASSNTRLSSPWDTKASGQAAHGGLDEWTSTSMAFKQRIADPFQSPGPLTTGSTADFERQVTQSFQRLEAQAAHINRLAIEQEQALRELRIAAEQVEVSWRAAEGSYNIPGYTAPTICEYTEARVPCVEWEEDGSLMLTTRTVDLFQAERDATQTAQVLRRRKRRQAFWLRKIPLPVAVQAWMNRPAQSPDRSPAPTPSHPAIPPMPTISIPDVVIWVLGAAIARVGFNTLLSTIPGMGHLLIGLIVAGVGFAIYRIAVAPRLSLVLGYYLFLIIIGLLLGGQL